MRDISALGQCPSLHSIYLTRSRPNDDAAHSTFESEAGQGAQNLASLASSSSLRRLQLTDILFAYVMKKTLADRNRNLPATAGVAPNSHPRPFYLVYSVHQIRENLPGVNVMSKCSRDG